jgi:hypothetical protein
MSTELIAGSIPVASVFDRDAQNEGVSRDELVRRWTGLLEQGVVGYRQRYSLRGVVSRVLLAA